MFRRPRLALATIALAFATPAHAGRDDWDKASDFALYSLWTAGAVAPFAYRDKGKLVDKEGLYRVAGTFVLSQTMTTVLKETIKEERPDGSDFKSFPSGHTSQSFAVAGSLHRRYGWEIGLPAHAVATFVGVARVKAHKHHVRDVIFGAAIGEASAWIVSRPKDSSVQWFPWGDTQGAGATVAYRF